MNYRRAQKFIRSKGWISSFGYTVVWLAAYWIPKSFEAPRHTNMQRLYHSVSGVPIEEIADLVDLAEIGKTCVSSSCVEYLQNWGQFLEISVGHSQTPKFSRHSRWILIRMKGSMNT